MVPIDPKLRAYADSLVPARPAVVQAMEVRAVAEEFPIVGPASANFCYLIARLIGARRVFELGSGYGYSTAFFAKAISENGGGEVFHIVWDDGLSEDAKKSLGELAYPNVSIHYHNAEAIETLRNTDGPFDLIFNDIDKDAYPAALPVIYEKLRVGGALLIDNMIWSGKVLEGEDDGTPETAGIKEFTKQITTDSRWAASLVPLRDGLILAMKLR